MALITKLIIYLSNLIEIKIIINYLFVYNIFQALQERTS